MAISAPARQDVSVLNNDDLVARPAEAADKAVLRRLLQLYLYDFSEFDGADLTRHGEFDYRYFDNYWTEADRHPFLIEVGGVVAGFAFVRTGSPHDMAEFFVMRKYRRRHIGRQAATSVFRKFPGEWQVRQLRSNAPATAFWRSAIPYPFVDSSNDAGPIQLFSVPGV